VVFENGLKLAINCWLDENHEPTEIGENARYFEFGDDETGYGCGDYDCYDMPSYSDH